MARLALFFAFRLGERHSAKNDRPALTRAGQSSDFCRYWTATQMAKTRMCQALVAGGRRADRPGIVVERAAVAGNDEARITADDRVVSKRRGF
jgi:hypothetical protein